MNILLFAGTTEGRVLAGKLAQMPVQATICVATGYGSELLEDFCERFTILTGRMDAEDMRRLLLGAHYDFVIDATHPYAVAASENIRAAASSASVPCLRLSRGESPKGACLYVTNAAEAARALAGIPGNVLLTTGVKELSAFTCVPDYAERMYPRVLPSVESVGRCIELGFKRGHIIAMQGPFSKDLNAAILREFAIAVVVTKDGGVEGGFQEKVFAAEEAGARTLVIGRPFKPEGLVMAAILAVIRAGLEAKE